MVQRQFLHIRFIALLVIIGCLVSVASAAAVEDAQLEAREPRKHRSKKTKAKTTSASDVFCKDFQKACYDVALNGRAPGQVQVEFACKRLGRKYSQYYHFACKVDGQDRTQAVLDKTGGGYTVTTTVHGSTSVVTGTVTATATSDVTATSRTTTTTTDAVPTTHVTPTTTTATVTLPSTVTTTSTASSFSFSPVVVRLSNVVIRPNRRRRAFAYDDNTAFCQDFTSACTRVCAQRAKSTVQGTVCRAQDSTHYSLGCYCKGGKVETQHALADAASQRNVQVVTTVDTSSTTVTVTSTQLRTTTQTLTSVTHTSTPTTVATSVSTSIIATTTYKPVTTEVVPTTTQVLLSPSGYIGAYNLGTNNYRDVLAYYPQFSGTNYGLSRGISEPAVQFIAVKDSNSAYYKLIHADNSNAFTATGGAPGGGAGYDYEPSSNAYTNIQPNGLASCGAASTTSGPPAGSGSGNYPCEQYVLRFSADGLTPSLSSFNASLVWVNPTGSATTDTSNLETYWGISSSGGANLHNSRSGTFGGSSVLIDLRFPLTTIPS